MKKIVIIASTGGAVLSKVLSVSTVKDSIHMVVSDRQCGAIDVAQSFGIKTLILATDSGKEFSDKLCNYFSDKSVDVFLSFYTKLFAKNFVKKYEGMLLNFHPSILPACPGMSGFEDTINSGAMFIGSTLHYVDEGIDTGQILMQSSYPYQHEMSVEFNRHIVFVQQCKIFIQFIEWFIEDRVVNKRIIRGRCSLSEFSPNLESQSAITFKTPLPS